VLANCMVLTEGFDEPTLQTVWVRRSGRGPTIQMAGRALRKCPGMAAKQIVQCNRPAIPSSRRPGPASSSCGSQAAGSR
jgi:superfamily II DNA or RNA helicase